MKQMLEKLLCLFPEIIFYGNHIKLDLYWKMKANDMLQRWFEDDDAMERALSGEYVLLNDFKRCYLVASSFLFAGGIYSLQVMQMES